MKKSILKRVVITGLFALLLSGCGSMPSMDFSNLFPSEIKEAAQARYANKSIEEALAMAEETFAKGIEEQLEFYAPEHFDDAQDALETARKLVSKKAKTGDIFEHAYLTEKNIEAGMQIKAAVNAHLAEPLRYKSALEKRGSDKSFAKEYANLMDDLDDLIELIEEGKPEKIAKDLPELVADLRALEIKTIKFNALNPGQTVLNRADKQGAEKIAPSLYKEATIALQQAEAFIQLNPYEETKIAEISAAFIFSAKHLLHVTEETIALQGLDKKGLVWAILQQEEQLLEIGKAMGAADVRDRPLAKQSAALAKRARDLLEKEKEAKRLMAALAEADKSQEALKGEISGQQSDVRMAKARINELEEQLKARMAAAEDDRLAARSRIAELEEQLEQLAASTQGDAQLTETRIADLEKQLKVTSADEAAAKARIGQLEQQLVATSTKTDKLQSQVSELNNALNTEKERNNRLAEKLTAASSAEAPAVEGQ